LDKEEVIEEGFWFFNRLPHRDYARILSGIWFNWVRKVEHKMSEREKGIYIDREGVIRQPPVDLGEPGIMAHHHGDKDIGRPSAPDARAAREAIADQGLSEPEREMRRGFVVGQEVHNPGLSSDDGVEAGFTITAIRPDGMVEIARPFLDEGGRDTGLRDRYAYKPEKVAGAQPEFMPGQYVSYEDDEGHFGKWSITGTYGHGAVRIQWEHGRDDVVEHIVSAATLARWQRRDDRPEDEPAPFVVKPKKQRPTWRNGFGLFRR